MTKKTAEQNIQEGIWSPTKCLLAATLLLLATVAVYRSSLDVPFFFDDPAAIADNPSIRHLWPLWDVLNPPPLATGATGRPLVNLSLAINYAAGGLDVRGYHATNIGLHLLTALTLWGVLRRTLRNERHRQAGSELFAFGAALLWAVHPLLTESVVCVVQRNEIMGSLHYLLTLYAFIRSVDGASRTIAWQAVAVVACLLGVASKEIVATAPLIVFLYDRTFIAGTFAAAWRQRGRFYLALAATWLLLAALMLGTQQRGGTVGFGLGLSSWEYLLTQCRALTIYLKLSLWPHPLVLDYGVEVSRLDEVWGRGLFVLALIGGTIWALWRKPVLGFLGAVFFVILAPSSSFVPLRTQTIAEHRMYLPLAAVLILVVGALWQLNVRVRRIALAALVCSASWVTVRHIDFYQSEAHLWADVIARVPGNYRAHTSLGRYLAQREQWAESLPHYSEALRLQPLYGPANYDISLVLVRLGRPAEALDYFSRIYPTYANEARFNFNYGCALTAAGRWAQGMALLETSLRLQPDQPDAHSALGLALEELGRPADAIEHYRAGLRLDPKHARLHATLGNALAGFRQWPEAELEFKRALDLQPDFAAVHHNLARLLMLLGRPVEAIPHYEQELKQLPNSAPVHHEFGVALALTGRVDEAIAQEEAALRLDPYFTPAREYLEKLRRK